MTAFQIQAHLCCLLSLQDLTVDGALGEDNFGFFFSETCAWQGNEESFETNERLSGIIS